MQLKLLSILFQSWTPFPYHLAVLKCSVRGYSQHGDVAPIGLVLDLLSGYGCACVISHLGETGLHHLVVPFGPASASFFQEQHEHNELQFLKIP